MHVPSPPIKAYTCRSWLWLPFEPGFDDPVPYFSSPFTWPATDPDSVSGVVCAELHAPDSGVLGKSGWVSGSPALHQSDQEPIAAALQCSCSKAEREGGWVASLVSRAFLGSGICCLRMRARWTSSDPFKVRILLSMVHDVSRWVVFLTMTRFSQQ